MFSTTVFLQGFPLLLHAALATIGISLTGLLIGFFVAIGVCAARLSPNRAARMFGGAYVFFFRGVPMLVQLLLVYYLLPFAGINVSPVVAAISTVSCCSKSGRIVCSQYGSRRAITSLRHSVRGSDEPRSA